MGEKQLSVDSASQLQLVQPVNEVSTKAKN